MASIGERIGAYELVEMIGKGAFGQVFRACAGGGADVPDGTVVALKILHNMHKDNERVVHRFHREARLATKLSHPHVVKILGEGVDGDEHYIVMELAQGVSLTEYLKQAGIEPPESKSSSKKVSPRKRTDNSNHEKHEKDAGNDNGERPILNLPIPDAIEITRQVAGVLQAAADIGLVHRDIKPDNIFVSKDKAGKIQTKILDFGLAKDLIAQTLSLSSMGHGVGTPPFMSPEQFLGIHMDIRSDLYSLGATTYEMLTGRAPFPGPTLSAYMQQHREEIPVPAHKLNPNVPENLSQVVERLLAKKADDRHQKPAELVEDLNRVERGEVPLKRYKPKKARKHSLGYTVTAIAAGVLLAVGLVFGMLYYQSANAGENIKESVSQAQYLANQGKLDDALILLNKTIAGHQANRPELLGDARELRKNVRQKIVAREAELRKLADTEKAALAEKARKLETDGDALMKSGEYNRALAAYESAFGTVESGALKQKIATAGRFKKEAETRVERARQIAERRAAAEQARKEAEAQRKRAEARRKADEERARKKAEARRKHDYRAAMRRVEQFIHNEDKLDEAVASAENAIDLAVTLAEEKPAREMLAKAKAALKARREWAAVVDFTIDKSVRDRNLTGRAVAVKVEQAVSDRYRLVTRSQISKALTELKFGVSDLADRRNAQKFGKIVGARYLITGSAVQLGRDITIAATIFSVQTGAIRQTAQVVARDVTEFNDLFSELAVILAMNRAEKRKYLDEKRNYPRYLAEGKDLLHRGRYEDAVRILAKAQSCKRTAEVTALLAQAREKAEEQRILAERTAQYKAALAAGSRLIRQGKWTEAESAYRKALAVPGYERDTTALSGIRTARGGAAAYQKKTAYENAYRRLLTAYNRARGTKDTNAWKTVKSLAEQAIGTGYTDVSLARNLLAEARKHLVPPYLRCPANAAKVKEAQQAAADALDGRVTKSINLGNGVTMKFALIPEGEFMMGSNNGDDDEKPVHKVKITKAFYMGAHEVTVGQFRRFVSAKGYRTEAERGDGAYGWTGKTWEKRKEFNWRNPGFTQTDSHPVCCVSWNDAQEFCKWLSTTKGATYRLPTEAEWEYACRAGTTTRFCFGDNDSELHKYGNYADRNTSFVWSDKQHNDGHSKTSSIGSYKPNAFALYDMHGNVWEWCQDWYDSGYYKNSPTSDPNGQHSGTLRVLRGGSWNDLPRYCRSAVRHWNSPSNTFLNYGFRVVGLARP